MSDQVPNVVKNAGIVSTICGAGLVVVGSVGVCAGVVFDDTELTNKSVAVVGTGIALAGGGAKVCEVGSKMANDQRESDFKHEERKKRSAAAPYASLEYLK